MTKAIRKKPDGKYHVAGKVYDALVGSRASVFHGNAYKTSGGLTKSDLMQNSAGRIVSAKKHATAKKEKRLEKHGFFTQKGKFGFVKKSPKGSKSKSKSKSKGKKCKKK